MTPAQLVAGEERSKPGSVWSRVPDPVRLWLLGGFKLSVGSRTVGEDEWRLRKAKSLLKLLALAPGHHMHRERIMDLLWPELNPNAAANNLRQALHVARRVFEPESTTPSRYLRLKDEELTLCPDAPLRVDVETFEGAAATARRSREPAAYRAALELYSGELLPEDRYEDWAEGRREELRGTYLALLSGLAELYEERGEYEKGIEALGRVVSSEPAREEAHLGLMRLYALSGQRGEALRQYEQLGKVLRRELRAEPGTESRCLREKILSEQFPPTGDRSSKGAPDAGDRHNLPVSCTSFVGRERELVEIKRELSMTRLLTLTGAGGSGKTRLALETARDLVGLYPDGVWLVELAPLSEEETVPQALATVLGVREQPGRRLVDTLVDALRKKEALLVLDNCEHLIDAVASLIETLLGYCPKLRVLATSREVLRVAGETSWAVPSLSLPDPRHPPAVEDLARFESAQLFLERARCRQPALVPSPRDVAAVMDICRRLDGIPLAIELAAARVGVMTVEQIAARLDDSLRLLTAGDRTAAPRQQTLRATLNWSYELLSESERTLFNRLSVFAGGWTLEAAEAVGAGEGIEGEEVLDLLGRLVDKSLVVAGAEDTLRYRMLEPVRQYGRQRLRMSGEADTVQDRHAGYYLKLAEMAEPESTGARRAGWLERLEIEHGNLRAALSWLLDREDPGAGERPELGLRLAAASWRFWSLRSPNEARRWLEAALEKDSSAGPAAVRVKALNGVGWIEIFQGDYERAVTPLEESLTLSREVGDKTSFATSLTLRGITGLHLGEGGRVAPLCEDAEALLPELVDQATIAYLLIFLGMAAMEERDHERAEALLKESLDINLELGDTLGIVRCRAGLILTALACGDYGRAVMPLKENLHTSRRLKDKRGIATCLLEFASLAGAQGRLTRAARLWGAAEALQEVIELPLSPFFQAHYDYEGHLAAARARLSEDAWEAAWAEGRGMTAEEAAEYALSVEEPTSCGMEEPSSGRLPVTLTRREEEVASFVGQGLTNRQIARELTLSERTVENHVRNILKKLDLPARYYIAAHLN